MFKKITAAVLAVALIAALWIVPASASSFTDSLFFNADFTSESTTDTVGGIVPTMTGSAPALEFVDSDETGTKVASFDGKKALSYAIDYAKVTSNFTMEAYVNFDEDTAKAGSFGLVAGTYWYNNHSGFGFVFSKLNEIGASRKFAFTQGGGNTTNIVGGSYKGGWKHLTYVHDGTQEYFYEDGALVATQAAKSASIPSDTTKGFRIGGYNLANNFDLKMECAYVRLYESAATEADVAALYENRNGDAPVVTEAPTETPISDVTPTPAPTPDSNLPVLPEGPAYKVVADDVPAFKKGDTVDITFKITDIEDAKGLMGVDLDIAYDYTLLQPVLNANGKPVVKSSASEIMEKYENSKWTATSRLDGEDTDTPTYVLKMFSDAETDAEEPQIDVAVKGDGELWFTISFEALADGTPDALLAYTVSADGTDSDINSIKGTGVHAFVASGDQPTPPVTDEKPTEVPTDVPTEQPTGQPTEKPTDGGNQKPGNTVTFDAGLVSLAAVALSSVVAAKKRRF